MTTAPDQLCPCGSASPFSACCAPIIDGTLPAPTAERLMRARYSAYVTGKLPFLFESTHPAHRKGYDHEGTRQWAEDSNWEGLEIVESRGGADDTVGEVEFVARYRDGETVHVHHEKGKFRKHEGCWYFVDGKMVGQKPIVSAKVGRNDPCPCGSGSKYKKCCGK